MPAHTVIQIAREAPLAAALVAADAALRHPPYAKRPPLLTLADLHRTDEQLRPYRGQVPGAAVLQRATPLADGHGKYLDAGSATGAAERVVHEKRREDELHGQVHRFGRWGWDEVWQVYPLERQLERVGVPRTRPRRRLFVLCSTVDCVGGSYRGTRETPRCSFPASMCRNCLSGEGCADGAEGAK